MRLMLLTCWKMLMPMRGMMLLRLCAFSFQHKKDTLLFIGLVPSCEEMHWSEGCYLIRFRGMDNPSIQESPFG